MANRRSQCTTSTCVRRRIATTRRCILRLAKYFDTGGDFLLDLGSGAIPHEELLSYHANFKKRVCVDLSITALKQARERLADRGEYVVADAAALPFKDGVFDAITAITSST